MCASRGDSNSSDTTSDKASSVILKSALADTSTGTLVQPMFLENFHADAKVEANAKDAFNDKCVIRRRMAPTMY
jgi:hypothetical protein